GPRRRGQPGEAEEKQGGHDRAKRQELEEPRAFIAMARLMMVVADVMVGGVDAVVVVAPKVMMPSQTDEREHKLAEHQCSAQDRTDQIDGLHGWTLLVSQARRSPGPE